MLDGTWLAAERARVLNAGCPLHRVPNQVAAASLREQLDEHVGEGWYAFLFYSDGTGVSRGATLQVAEPPPPIWSRLRAFALELNRSVAEDGHWIVAYSAEHEPVALWRDGDGDAHAVMEIPAVGLGVLNWMPMDVVNLAHAALMETKHRLAHLELSKGQQFRGALGERPERRRH